jgi:hypothetical protein
MHFLLQNAVLVVALLACTVSGGIARLYNSVRCDAETLGAECTNLPESYCCVNAYKIPCTL